MLKKLSTLAIAGIAATIATFAANPAEAVVVTVGGTNYDITTVDGSFNDLESQLTATPWFGNQTLAEQLAGEVEDSLGIPNFGRFGGIFTYSSNVDYNFLYVFDNVNGSVGNYISNNTSSLTYATGTATPVPEPLTILGTVVALGFGAKFKQKASKSA